MREIIRKIILIVAAILAIAALVFIFVALCKHFGWLIPTLILAAIIAFLAWRIWKFGGVTRLINFIASLILIAVVAFLGWALWQHFFGAKNDNASNGAISTQEIKVEDEKSENSQKTEDKKGEKSTPDQEKSSSEADKKLNNSDISNEKNQNHQTPSELPKTGVDFQF